MTKSFHCLLMLFFALHLSAADHQIKMNVDWAVFQYDQNQLYVELYYSFRQTDLTYKSGQDGWTAMTLGTLRVLQSGTLYKEYVWKNQNLIADSSELSLS